MDVARNLTKICDETQKVGINSIRNYSKNSLRNLLRDNCTYSQAMPSGIPFHFPLHIFFFRSFKDFFRHLFHCLPRIVSGSRYSLKFSIESSAISHDSFLSLNIFPEVYLWFHPRSPIIHKKYTKGHIQKFIYGILTKICFFFLFNTRKCIICQYSEERTDKTESFYLFFWGFLHAFPFELDR